MFAYACCILCCELTAWNTSQVILCGDTAECGIPGGWGAAGAPNDGFHQFLHVFTKSYSQSATSWTADFDLRTTASGLNRSQQASVSVRRGCLAWPNRLPEDIYIYMPAKMPEEEGKKKGTWNKNAMVGITEATHCLYCIYITYIYIYMRRNRQMHYTFLCIYVSFYTVDGFCMPAT